MARCGRALEKFARAEDPPAALKLRFRSRQRARRGLLQQRREGQGQLAARLLLRQPGKEQLHEARNQLVLLLPTAESAGGSPGWSP
jgi:hypothetical protein